MREALVIDPLAHAALLEFFPASAGAGGVARDGLPNLPYILTRISDGTYLKYSKRTLNPAYKESRVVDAVANSIKRLGEAYD